VAGAHQRGFLLHNVAGSFISRLISVNTAAASASLVMMNSWAGAAGAVDCGVDRSIVIWNFRLNRWRSLAVGVYA
jgi:hypothetical protein